MSTPAAEKQQPGFEKQIESQLQAMDFSSEVLDAQSLETDRVSEIVREGAGEDVKSGSGTKQTRLKIISQQVAGLIAGGSGKAQAKSLPKPVVQQRKVRKSLEKRTRKLVAEAMRIQRNPHKFSASRLEEIVLEIRHLREILAGLLHATVERIEDLYRRFVLGSK